MFPEKEIVGLWLNSQGYLVVSDINAGKNKVVDALALKVEDGQLKEAVHVEVSVSVSSPTIDLSDFQAKFSDPLVKKAIHGVMKRFSGQKEYKMLLVANNPAVKNIGEIEIKPFEDVFVDVLSSLDRQNYSDPTVRTLQLLRYLILSNPEGLNRLFSKTITSAGMDRLIELMLELPEAKRVFAKEKNKPRLEAIFSGSVVAKPEALAEFIIKSLSTRSFNQFLKELFQHEKAKKFTTKTSQKQKTLQVFLD
jgi:hypothetical protein